MSKLGREVLEYVRIEWKKTKKITDWIGFDVFFYVFLKLSREAPADDLDHLDPDLVQLPEAYPVSEPSCSARGDHALRSLHQIGAKRRS